MNIIQSFHRLSTLVMQAMGAQTHLHSGIRRAASEAVVGIAQAGLEAAIKGQQMALEDITGAVQVELLAARRERVRDLPLLEQRFQEVIAWASLLKVRAGSQVGLLIGIPVAYEWFLILALLKCKSAASNVLEDIKAARATGATRSYGH